MATKIYFRSSYAGAIGSPFTLGTNTAKADTNASAWTSFALLTSKGAGAAGAGTSNTVTGPTSGVEIVTSALPIEWFSEPLAADVTISGTVTFNVWMSENNMSANVAA